MSLTRLAPASLYVSSYYLPSLDAAVRSFKMVSSVVPVHTDAEIEMVMTSLGHGPKSGLVAMPHSFMLFHREVIISLAAQYKVPAIYFHSSFPRDGALLSYTTDSIDQLRRAAAYIDRILRGAKPADLPVQLPVKFEMI